MLFCSERHFFLAKSAFSYSKPYFTAFLSRPKWATIMALKEGQKAEFPLPILRFSTYLLKKPGVNTTSN